MTQESVKKLAVYNIPARFQVVIKPGGAVSR
jgi:hypothetical protein